MSRIRSSFRKKILNDSNCNYKYLDPGYLHRATFNWFYFKRMQRP